MGVKQKVMKASVTSEDLLLVGPIVHRAFK